MPRQPEDITPELRAIGRAFAEAREATGMTQAQAAAALKIKPAILCHWESGRRCPPMTKIPKIAEVYGTHPWLFMKKVFEKMQNCG